jgi:Carboxypeptidase regulatory-like domain/TonB-dependent Receptor Plug Domain
VRFFADSDLEDLAMESKCEVMSMITRVNRSKSFALSFLLVFALWLAAFPKPAKAQIGNATLGGTVTDPSGGAIADAELTLANKANGVEAKASSNERGEYTFTNLTPGAYDLKITKTGFQNYIQVGLVITINASARADAVLKVGTQSQTVTVEGSNILINYDNGTLQGGADPETVKDLPLVIEGKPRSSAALAVLLPGISTGGSNQAFQARINGGQESGDEALLDGATMQEGFMSQSGMVSIHQDFQMSPDMIQEVKVLTSNYDAQYGSSTSGQITMVSKSGTSQYHGAVFEYGRNAALNATQWGKAQKSADNEHNFGANIGGPVKIPFLYHGTSKHHSFFYFDWESYHQAGGSNSPTLSIPSVAERGGDFRDWKDSNGNLIPIYDPQCGNPVTGCAPGQLPTQFSCNGAVNVICPDRISPIAAAYLAELPAPTNSNPTNNYTLSKPVPDTLTSNSNVYMFRIDHNYGDKDHFYFFWWRQFTGFNTATELPTAIATESPTRPQNSPIARFNWEHTFTSTMTNHATFGYLNRNEGYGSENLDFIGKLPQVPGAAGTNALPAFTFSDGFNQISNSNGPPNTNITVRPTWVFNDMVAKVYGRHTLTFGMEWRSVQGNIHQSNNESGTYGFDRSTTSLPGVTSGSPVAGFLLGAVSGGSTDRRVISAWYPRQTVWALHANDSWKITTKFTLNYGLRWDYYTPSREKHNHFSFIDTVGINPDAGGLPGRLAFAGNRYGDASFHADYPEEPWHKGFAPRLGAAYSWNQKTVIRAGYGIFFAQAFYPGWGGGMSLDGFNLHQTFGTSVNGVGATVPAFYLDQGVPTPAQLPPFIDSAFDNGTAPTQANGNGSAYRPVDANRRPYSQQWNLTIERQLPAQVYLSVAYVGNKGTRLTSSLQPINTLNPFDTQIRALEAPSLSNPGTPKLNDVFKPGDISVDGVSAPYAGWVDQLDKAGVCAPTVAQALLPFPQYCGPLQGLNENHGNSIYHSFQLKAEKRYSKGLYMLVSYTASKLISDASDNTQQLGGSWNATQGVISPYEKVRARTLSSDDVPQIFSAAFVYDLPIGKGQRYANRGGFSNVLLGGWQLSPIIHWNKGTPMWFRSGTCQVVPQFRQKCLVGLVPGVDPFLQDPSSYNPGKGSLLNSAAFEPLSSFLFTDTSGVGGSAQFGYTGDGPRISNLRGPNSKNWDFSVTKNTRIGERMNFQLRFAFFNAFNQHWFYNAANVNNQGSSFAFNNDIAAPNFGAWNGGVSSPRTIQIGARFEF